MDMRTLKQQEKYNKNINAFYRVLGMSTSHLSGFLLEGIEVKSVYTCISIHILLPFSVHNSCIEQSHTGFASNVRTPTVNRCKQGIESCIWPLVESALWAHLLGWDP